MKKIILIALVAILSVQGYAQSKKELAEKISILEEKVSGLEQQVSELQKTISSNSETIIQLKQQFEENKTKTELNKNKISSLQFQNDSLKSILATNHSSPFISNPRNESDSIIFVIQQYLSAPNWQGRKLHVIKPDKNSALMKDYYSTNYKPQKVEKDKITIQGNNFKIGDKFTVFVKSTEYYFEKTANGYKIDWLASIGYNETSLKTYQATLSTQPKTFRVIAEISNKYNWNYDNKQNSYWSVRANDGRGAWMICYVSKQSETGKQIYEILKDGKEHRIMIEVKIDSKEDKSGRTTIITKLIKTDWRTI